MRILTFRFYVGSHGGEDSQWSVSGCRGIIKDGSSTFIISGGNEVPEDTVSQPRKPELELNICWQVGIST